MHGFVTEICQWDESDCESSLALLPFPLGHEASNQGGDFVKQGLYRTNDPLLGECARICWSAGDGAPFLRREIYEAVHFQPLYDALPTEEEFRQLHHSCDY